MAAVLLALVPDADTRVALRDARSRRATFVTAQ